MVVEVNGLIAEFQVAYGGFDYIFKLIV
jgi:hypothetical protein